jgi:hypothetical protein
MKFDRRTADALYWVSFGAFALRGLYRPVPEQATRPQLAYQVHLPPPSRNVAAA